MKYVLPLLLTIVAIVWVAVVIVTHSFHPFDTAAGGLLVGAVGFMWYEWLR